MTWASSPSEATNTLPLYVSQPTPHLKRESGLPARKVPPRRARPAAWPRRAAARTVTRRSLAGRHDMVYRCNLRSRRWKSAGRVADQLDTVAVPAELHHAVEALHAAGVLQRDGVAGGGGV